MKIVDETNVLNEVPIMSVPLGSTFKIFNLPHFYMRICQGDVLLQFPKHSRVVCVDLQTNQLELLPDYISVVVYDSILEVTGVAK